MTKHRRSKNEIVAVILVCCIPVVVFVVWYVFNMATSPYNFAEYHVESTKCEQLKEYKSCTVRLTIKNNSDREFSPDFTGTHGPGFAESGVWGAYIVTSKGEKIKVYVDEATYNIIIAPRATVQTSSQFQMQSDASPREIVLFDEKIQL